MSLLHNAGTAAGAFVATNVDDIVILAVLSTRRDDRFRTRHLLLGQGLGFAVLVAASLTAAVGLLRLPQAATGLLGLVPIAIGAVALLRAGATDAGGDDVAVPPVLTTATVAGVTIASGADNVAVYAPLFATVGPAALGATVAVFLTLLLGLVALALAIGGRPSVVRAVDAAGDRAVPVLLIAVGVYVVIESGLPAALA